MAAKVSQPTFEQAGTPVLPMLDALILYEDLSTALRAKYSLDRLPRQLGANAGLTTKLWRLDLLRQLFLKEQAAIEAAAADVIILSVHGRTDLPVAVREWLGRWLDQKEDRPYAFGVLLDPQVASQGCHNPVLAHVQRIADAGGSDLFCGFCEAPASELDSAIAEISERTHRSSSVLEEMLKRSPRHRWWGINE
jgi:hypothetical protein